MTTSTSNPPADHVRLGSVQAAIWRNADSEGRIRYSATLKKRYKDANGDWQSTTSFNRDELPTAAKAFDMAHTRIFELQAIDREQAASNGAAKSKAKSR